MSGFEKGEPLICVAEVDPQLGDGSAMKVGARYTCEDYYFEPHSCHCGSQMAVEVEERPDSVYCECHFARPPKRDLSAWLKTSVSSTDHLDKPLPAKKRERVE